MSWDRTRPVLSATAPMRPKPINISRLMIPHFFSPEPSRFVQMPSRCSWQASELHEAARHPQPADRPESIHWRDLRSLANRSLRELRAADARERLPHLAFPVADFREAK